MPILSKREKILFYTTVGVRLCMFVMLVLWFKHFPIVGSDSQSYLSAAESLWSKWRFLGPDGMPNSYEMPGYPVFLVICIHLIKNIFASSLIQYILMGATAVMIYRIGYVFSERVATTAGFLFALDPVGIFYSGFVITEPLFIFLVVTMAYIMVKNFSDTNYKSVFLAGLFLGGATMVRPVGEIFVPICLMFYFFKEPLSWKRFTVASAVFVSGFLLIVGPWMVRNTVLFGRSELSAVASLQFAYAHAPLFYAYENHISDSEAISKFNQRLLEISPYKKDILANNSGILPNAPYMWQVAFEYIGQHPFAYARFHALKTIPFFVGDGLREAAARSGLLANDLPNLGNFILRGDVRGLFKVAVANNIALILLIVGASFWFLVNMGMVLGIIRFFRIKGLRRAIVVSCFLYVVSMAVVAGGVVSSPRYRFSITPFMFILAAVGFAYKPNDTVSFDARLRKE